MIGRSWTEINLNTIKSNYKIYKDNLPDNMEIMAVIKADGYGHGDVEVAKAVQELGCYNFAVSNIQEAKQLREHGIKGQILILGYTPVSAADDLLKYDITQAIVSENYAEQLQGKGIKAQFAIDTGMNRIGIDGDNPKYCEKIIRQFKDKFILTGLFTHLCAADTESENEFTKQQINKFKNIAESISDLKMPYIHCMNTAGGLFCEPYGNLVRLGISLYGLKPDYSNTLPEGIKPALEWKSVVAMIKKVYPGETIGYGRTYTASEEMTIATIPTGYADGYNRALSNKGFVLVNGQKAQIVGRICMDQFMIDVTGLDVHFEDEVVLLGDGYTADDMAQTIGTIGYEIVCAISKRIVRRYCG